MLVLLYLFNPTVSSMRAIQQASELKKVQRELGSCRASLGSLLSALPLLVEAMQLNHEKGSSYVCRVRDNSKYEILEDRPLSPQAQAAGVLQDAIVRFGKSSKSGSRPDHPIRLITIRTTPHVKCSKYKGGSTEHGSACMLISLWTGRKPTLRTYEMICQCPRTPAHRHLAKIAHRCNRRAEQDCIRPL